MPDLPVARLPNVQSQLGAEFFERTVGPVEIELVSPWEDSGDPATSWLWTVQPDYTGYYKVSVSVRKISGDTRNVQIVCGQTAGNNTFASGAGSVAGVVPWDPEYSIGSLGAAAFMDLEGTSAVVSVSAFVCTWS